MVFCVDVTAVDSVHIVAEAKRTVLVVQYKLKYALNLKILKLKFIIELDHRPIRSGIKVLRSVCSNNDMNSELYSPNGHINLIYKK